MYIKFEPISPIDQKQFIEYWAELYNYDPKHPLCNKLYDENIIKEEYSEKDIFALYAWKNGMALSKKKAEAVKQIVLNLDRINELKKSNQTDLYSSLYFIPDGVWKLFLLHIINPAYYPIFDQHTYRAYQYIKSDMILEMPKDKSIMIKFYLNDYIPFIHEYIQDSDYDLRRMNIRKMDKALFAFGRFLKSPFVKMINNPLDTELILSIFSSVYSHREKGTYQFSLLLETYLTENPDHIEDVCHVLEKRDFYMQDINYDKRWEMGRFLMDQFGIQFEQSEGSELIFSLCLAIKNAFSLTDNNIGKLLEIAISKKYLR
ncbi:hypothetical protein [Robertmurraya andreesenii]|uniref:DUF4007 domain-containing protein n=1 Tax=Anoxybacillus andreesenii TaxID=1325932 RepID=A0ABT9V6F3_9BACL|nr:hypothetical protein [Robertmurraya andreesenii]MDQ0156532.1 hypothetical protein [Robertmurraya andreesenii]